MITGLMSEPELQIVIRLVMDYFDQHGKAPSPHEVSAMEATARMITGCSG